VTTGESPLLYVFELSFCSSIVHEDALFWLLFIGLGCCQTHGCSEKEVRRIHSTPCHRGTSHFT
jgi:hypothetical protein